jgi:hypothetical protein
MDRGENKGKKILWERAAQHPSYDPPGFPPTGDLTDVQGELEPRGYGSSRMGVEEEEGACVMSARLVVEHAGAVGRVEERRCRTAGRR